MQEGDKAITQYLDTAYHCLPTTREAQALTADLTEARSSTRAATSCEAQPDKRSRTETLGRRNNTRPNYGDRNILSTKLDGLVTINVRSLAEPYIALPAPAEPIHSTSSYQPCGQQRQHPRQLAQERAHKKRDGDGLRTLCILRPRPHTSEMRDAQTYHSNSPRRAGSLDVPPRDAMAVEPIDGGATDAT